jgi:hypothetical protein
MLVFPQTQVLPTPALTVFMSFQSATSTNTGQGTITDTSGGTDLTGPVTVTETVVSVTTAPPAGPGASTDKGATPSLAESPKDGGELIMLCT